MHLDVQYLVIWTYHIMVYCILYYIVILAHVSSPYTKKNTIWQLQHAMTFWGSNAQSGNKPWMK